MSILKLLILSEEIFIIFLCNVVASLNFHHEKQQNRTVVNLMMEHIVFISCPLCLRDVLKVIKYPILEAIVTNLAFYGEKHSKIPIVFFHP
jgi:hypothetical protein